MLFVSLDSVKGVKSVPVGRNCEEYGWNSYNQLQEQYVFCSKCSSVSKVTTKNIKNETMKLHFANNVSHIKSTFLFNCETMSSFK